MKTHLIFSAALALLLPAALLSAQQPASRAQAAKPGEVNVTGCLQREVDYRALHKDGRGGVLGTGVGTANEYVLMGAKPTEPPKRVAGAAVPAAMDYSLTGKLENNMLKDVGRMVEVVGTVAKADKQGELSRLTITVWHPVGDFCPVTK